MQSWSPSTATNGSYTFGASGSTYLGRGPLSTYFKGDIDEIRLYNSSLTAANIASLAAVTPIVATAAAASPAQLLLRQRLFRCWGRTPRATANLTYTWAATTIPNGATAPIFSVNGNNAAQNTVATFSKAGIYTFTVTMVNRQGLSTTVTVNVTVNQTPKVTVTPGGVSIAANGTQTFTVASAVDQFGNSLGVSSWAWSASTGSINASAGGSTPHPVTPTFDHGHERLVCRKRDRCSGQCRRLWPRRRPLRRAR